MTTVSKQEFADYIRQFRHKELFDYLGWDNDRTTVPPQKAGEEVVAPKIIADKNGFKIITVHAKLMPLYAVRSQVVVALKKLFAESIIIFSDKDKREQVWRYGKVEIKYNISQDTERLYQRASGLIFDIDEQDNITIVGVTSRVKTNFAVNAEKVAKKFYDAFRKEHKALEERLKSEHTTAANGGDWNSAAKIAKQLADIGRWKSSLASFQSEIAKSGIAFGIDDAEISDDTEDFDDESIPTHRRSKTTPKSPIMIADTYGGYKDGKN
jgi:hypothetical protein